MNNKAMVIGLVILIVLIGIGAYVMSGRNSASLADLAQNATSTESSATTTTTSTNPKSTTPTSYKSLISINGSYECDFTHVNNTSQNNNVIYIADGKLRGEFRTTGQGGNIVVYDGRYLYTWKEGAAVGARSEPKTIADLPTIIPNDLTSAEILGSGLKSAGWDCHQWIKNPSLLVAPSAVKFQ